MTTALLTTARALWYTAPLRCEIRQETLPDLQGGDVLVKASYSAFSRGTERLVASGQVPTEEYDRMRAPFQDGTFPFPVKYGYCSVGTVIDGASELVGKPVFCLHPHQDYYIVPKSRVTPLPDELPQRRATLAANMETALNALWDSGAGPGDRIVVVGAGIVGLLVTHLAAQLPGAEVFTVDINDARRPHVEQFGATFCAADHVPDNADVVFHTSAHPSGLATALEAAGTEATVVELSWYGTKPVAVPLGGHFHAGRLRLISSQVGMVSHTRRARWDYARRMGAALTLLADPRFDRLLSNDVPFSRLGGDISSILDGNTETLTTTISYNEPLPYPS